MFWNVFNVCRFILGLLLVVVIVSIVVFVGVVLFIFVVKVLVNIGSLLFFVINIVIGVVVVDDFVGILLFFKWIWS